MDVLGEVQGRCGLALLLLRWWEYLWGVEDGKSGVVEVMHTNVWRSIVFLRPG